MHARWAAFLCVVALGGCSLDGNGAPGLPDAAPAADLAPRRLEAGTWRLVLDAGAFPPTTAHPSALVYVPSGFDPSPPISVVVYLHGFDNCVDNVVRDAGQSCDPDAGTPVRSAAALVAQLEAANVNALLVVPEIDFDQATGNPGNLARAGAFAALLDEALRDLAPVLGPLSSTDVGHLVVASHSGGYQATAAIASVGGVRVDEIWLFDSLYGDTAQFDAWVKADLGAFVPTDGGATPFRRFADVYTGSGGTLANSQAMATRARAWVAADAGVLVDDRTPSTGAPPDALAHGLYFKYTSLAHDLVPRLWFLPLLSTSRLARKQ